MRSMYQSMEAGSADTRWYGLYRLGGVAALLIAVLLAGEVVIYARYPRPETALEHFELFQDNWLVGLLTLDLLGMLAYLLFIPTMLALYVTLRHISEAVMAVAAVLFFLGVAGFFATNTAFSVLALSDQYAETTSDAERAMTLAAGQAMFTLFNESAFLVSYVMVSAAWLMISVVMLRSTVFSRKTSLAGILAGAAGVAAVVLEHVSTMDAMLALAIALYFAAIVFLFIWVVLAGWRLYQLGTVDTVAGSLSQR
jgi:hypothetical protein